MYSSIRFLSCLTWILSLSGITEGFRSRSATLEAFAKLSPRADNATAFQLANQKRTFSIGYVVFPGWEPLDVWGPLEILFQMSYMYNMNLSIIAKHKGPIGVHIPSHVMVEGEPPMNLDYMINPTIVATHSFHDAPKLDMLFVPGGTGLDVLALNGDTSVQDFIRSRYHQLKYLLSVCTGSGALANSGVLNGKRATTNKAAWAGVSKLGKNVTWVPSARWVVDGNIWTSSGVSAGLDMVYAFMNYLYGGDYLTFVMNLIEYAPHTNPHWDPFAIVHDVPGHDTNGSLIDCVGPVGFD